MKEELLHFIWKYKLFYTLKLETVSRQTIEVISIGTHNLNAGPDFLNAKIRVGEQLWARNVEIHVKSSDWYVHGHENDQNYDAVILHVVWENDVDVFDSSNNRLPTLELKQLVTKELFKSYRSLFTKSNVFINCERLVGDVDKFIIGNWQERLYLERLERKSKEINSILKKSENDWEQVLFQLLAKNFGLKLNSESFFKMATDLDYNIIRKESQSLERLESLLFGQLGMLKKESEIPYYQNLKREYNYQMKKYKLSNSIVEVHYFRLRPSNFPTMRIAQLAGLLFEKRQLFTDVMRIDSVKEFYNYFKIQTSQFWDIHYTFETISSKRIKKITNSFVDLLLINTIIPLKFVYLKQIGKFDLDQFLQLIKEIKPEKNSIVEKFGQLSFPVSNAFETQAILELKNNYCAPQKCLECAIGHNLLRS